MTRGPQRGAFRSAIDALEIGATLFVPLPLGGDLSRHHRIVSARKSRCQENGKRFTTRRDTGGVWIERVK